MHFHCGSVLAHEVRDQLQLFGTFKSYHKDHVQIYRRAQLQQGISLTTYPSIHSTTFVPFVFFARTQINRRAKGQQGISLTTYSSVHWNFYIRLVFLTHKNFPRQTLSKNASWKVSLLATETETAGTATEPPNWNGSKGYRNVNGSNSNSVKAARLQERQRH